MYTISHYENTAILIIFVAHLKEAKHILIYQTSVAEVYTPSLRASGGIQRTGNIPRRNIFLI